MTTHGSKNLPTKEDPFCQSSQSGPPLVGNAIKIFSSIRVSPCQSKHNRSIYPSSTCKFPTPCLKLPCRSFVVACPKGFGISHRGFTIWQTERESERSRIGRLMQQVTGLDWLSSCLYVLNELWKQTRNICQIAEIKRSDKPG